MPYAAQNTIQCRSGLIAASCGLVQIPPLSSCLFQSPCILATRNRSGSSLQAAADVGSSPNPTSLACPE
jgi:hypothetical protein